jgi:hypothetical protein
MKKMLKIDVHNFSILSDFEFSVFSTVLVEVDYEINKIIV